MSIIRSISYLIAAILCACTSSPPTYTISVDPSFYSIDAQGKEKNILAFLSDLTAEIAQRSAIALQLQSVNWNTLYEGLEKKQYAAVISGMPRYNFTAELYSFSDIFLETGPVLVTKKSTPYKSLSKLSGQEVGIISDSNGAEILASYPKIITRNYDSLAKMLSDLESSVLQGAIVDLIPAIGYTKDLYSNTLQIASEPLSSEGLRLITLKNSEKHLMQIFSKEMKQLQKEGYIEHLLRKWGLAN